MNVLAVIGGGIISSLVLLRMQFGPQRWPFMDNAWGRPKKMLGRWYTTGPQMNVFLQRYRPGQLVIYQVNSPAMGVIGDLRTVSSLFVHRHFPWVFAMSMEGKCLFCGEHMPEPLQMIQKLQGLKGIR